LSIAIKDNKSGLVKIATVYGRHKAWIFKSKLESEGIPAVLKGGAEIFGVTIDGLGAIDLLVLKDDAKKAEKILFKQ